LTGFRLQAAYKNQLKLSSAKKADLISLCDSGAVPSQYRSFYDSLCEDALVRDSLADPDIEEESEEDF